MDPLSPDYEPSEPPVPPFLRLPTELKARIVKLVSEQDGRYSRSARASPTWFGRGVSALALVNHLFNELAAEQLFKVQARHLHLSEFLLTTLQFCSPIADARGFKSATYRRAPLDHSSSLAEHQGGQHQQFSSRIHCAATSSNVHHYLHLAQHPVDRPRRRRIPLRRTRLRSFCAQQTQPYHPPPILCPWNTPLVDKPYRLSARSFRAFRASTLRTLTDEQSASSSNGVPVWSPCT